MHKDLIYDVGLNNGDDTAYYLSKGYRVIGIEAHPGLAEQASRRFAREIADGRVIVVNAAIAESEREYPFWVCESVSEWSSFDRSIASRQGAPHHEVNVRGRKFSSILKEYGVPYFLKIDIEGNDYLCIQGLEQPDVPAYLSIEQSGTARSNLDLLRSLGYSKFKCISQIHYLPLQLDPTPEELQYGKYWKGLSSRSIGWKIARRLGGRQLLWKKLGELRRKDDWVFPFGSSGPFGEETLGRWLSYDEFQQTLNQFNERFARGEPGVFWGPEKHSFWADYHMKLDGVN
jgi:FkbM family methyltransferase